MLKLKSASGSIRYSLVLNAGYQPTGSPAIGSIPYEEPIMYWGLCRITVGDEIKRASEEK